MAFGGVWKESLSELSGGQKSLLALSLILAMLLFKPAPIYILDEVGAGRTAQREHSAAQHSTAQQGGRSSWVGRASPWGQAGARQAHRELAS